MADADMEYLSPTFDPSSLTIPRLRNILMTHDIQYPASAKKPQLVDIFLQELKPRARKLLAARDRVRRTSRGIIDMPRSQGGTVNGDNDDDNGPMPPPPVPDTSTQRKSRKSGRVAVKDGEPEAPALTRASGSKRSSSKHARPSDTDTDHEPELPRPAIRKTRKSEAPVRVRGEETEEVSVRPPMRGGVFSDENPFQSGSSPLTAQANRRRSAGASSDRRKTSSNRRKTEGVPGSELARRPQEDGVTVPTSKTFEVPVSRLKKQAPEEGSEDGVPTGEEFAPEEQLELVRERAANGEKDILPPRRFKRSRKSNPVPKSAPWIVFTTLLAGYATWYRQEKLAVGYCGIGRPSTVISNVQIPEWASALLPTCEPCPQHAICYDDMGTRCDQDFVLQPHPLSLGGLVPLPPTCEPDGEKVRRIKAVADRAVEELRERKAQAECGTFKDGKGKGIPAEIDEKDLKKDVGRNRRRGMGEAEFEELWKGAIGEITGREEIVTSADGRLLASTSLARLPLACTLRRSARQALARHRLSISFVVTLFLAAFYVRNLILKARSDNARVPSLVATTLDRLATQAALHARGNAGESWISVGQLRDDVLRDEFSEARREGIWKRVRAVVERNANVRASVREGRGGDVSRVWEWIGSVGLLEGPESSEGRKRVGWGGVVDDSTPEGRVGPAGIGGEIVERKWDEGRPIY